MKQKILAINDPIYGMRNTKYGAYFDYAAATPISSSVKAAMEPYFTDNFYNPSAQYLAAQQVHKALERARADVASCLAVRPSEVIFTAGGTEANNLAIHGIMSQYPDANCIVSAIEHDAVLEPAAKYDCRIAPVKTDGRVDLVELEKLIDEKTVLISIMYANNEIGTIQPITEISKLIKKDLQKRLKNHQKSLPTPHSPLPLYLHTDACQAPNYLQVLPNSLGVDMLTLNGGKIYGPKQSGALYVKSGVKLEPLIYGGGQERKMRSGTENVPAIIGFAKAIKEAVDSRESESDRLKTLSDGLAKLLVQNTPAVIINGSREYRLPNNIHMTIPGYDNERLMMELDEMGFMVAVGSACSASSDEPSHVLRAIGLNEADARSSLRITLGRYTTEKDCMLLASALAQLINKSKPVN